MSDFTPLSNASGELPSADAMASHLATYLTPLLRRFVTWRHRTHSERTALDVAGLVSPATERPSRTVDLRGDGAQRMRSWDGFLHTFSRDEAWDVPVGAYGHTWSHQLAAVAEGLRHDIGVFADTDQTARSTMGGVNRDLVYHATYWGATIAGKEPNWWVAAPLQTMREGITSVAQVLAMLTLDAVPGYQSPLQLAHDSVAAGLLDRLANTYPINVLEPAIACGLVLPGPVVVAVPAGTVDLGPDASEFLSEQSFLYRDAVAARTDEDRLHDGRAAAGSGCPVAVISDGRSALSDLAGLFLELIKQLNRPPGRQHTHHPAHHKPPRH